MTQTKYLLYGFKTLNKKNYTYWYETDKKYFSDKKPPKTVLEKNPTIRKSINQEEIIVNPWNSWESNNVQKITSNKGICINYLKTTNSDEIQTIEDLKLLELYSYLIENYDIAKGFGFKTIQVWHMEIFKEIYPFAGKLRNVEMSKGDGAEAWIWRMEFLEALPQFDQLLADISSKSYIDIDEITKDLSQLVSEFLFIHPFREGNGRLSRLICDIILAKNGFPMIGLNLKKGDNYIQRIHEGYLKNYESLQELLKQKLEEEIMNG